MGIALSGKIFLDLVVLVYKYLSETVHICKLEILVKEWADLIEQVEEEILKACCNKSC